MEFEPNPDILAEVARLQDGPWCVGFAAETEKLAEHAEAKRARKGIPLLVGNLAQKVMDADTTELVLFDAQGVHPRPPPAAGRRAAPDRRDRGAPAGPRLAAARLSDSRCPQSAQSGAFPTVCKCASEP